MANKVVSIRIEDYLLDYIDDAVKHENYINRSDVINFALRVAVEYHKKNRRFLGRGFNRLCNDVIDKMEFEFHREHK